MTLEYAETIKGLLQALTGDRPEKNFEALRSLFAELNYEYQKVELPLSGDAEKCLAGHPLVIAEAGGYRIVYARLADERLKKTSEREVLKELAKKLPYALFIFSNKSQNSWHFINIKDINADEKKITDRTKKLQILRRITIAPEERLRTASQRIAMLNAQNAPGDMLGVSPLAVKALHDAAFNVEAVTKAFFEEYKGVFNELWGYLEKQTDDRKWAHDYALLFLNRLMFLYFIQRKKWLGNDPEFLATFYKAYKQSGQPKNTFFEKWLSVMFFKAFNHKYQGGHTQFPKEINEALANAPWLNGGLFRKNEFDNAKVFNISDEVFKKIFDFLESYNFTITEDSPLDQEVAVDPEMIGNVYESLVNASDEIDERGDAGIFYTPRTEIDLMCRLSLVQYLANHLGEKYKTELYEAVFAFSEEDKKDADAKLVDANLWVELHKLLKEITVVDPACGSGSFLVGMLHVLDDLLSRANHVLGESPTAYQRRKDIIGKSIYGVDVMKWAVEIAELRLWLQLVVETELKKEERTLTPLLPNLSFKIRCGDSLVQRVGDVDMTQIKGSNAISAHLKGRLTRLKGDKLKYYNNEENAKDKAALEKEEIDLFLAILEDSEQKLVNVLKGRTGSKSMLDGQNAAAGGDKNEAIKAELEKTRQALAALKRGGNPPFVWDIAFVEIFDGDNAGFDVVIGNPPYVRQEYISDPHAPKTEVTTESKKAYKDRLIRSVYAKYPYFFGVSADKPKRKLDAKSDLYIYFYFHGLSLLNKSGAFCFITSNSWLDVGYGADLQEFLLRHCAVNLIIDNSAKRSFASADVNTIIALLSPPQKEPENGDKPAKFVMFTVPYELILSPVIFEEIDKAAERSAMPEYRISVIQHGELLLEGGAPEEDDAMPAPASKGGKSKGPLIKVTKYIGNKWGGKYLRAPDIYWTILEKGKGKLVRLGDIAEVRRGVTTGANEFFYLNEEKISEWNIEEEFLRPVIFSLKEIKKIMDDMSGISNKMIYCHREKKSLRDTNLLRYIEWGESQGFNKRPSCASRNLWYSLAENWKPAPFVFPAKVGERMLVLDNRKNIFEDKKLYGITPKSTGNIYWGAILNSTLTRLLMDLSCRQLTGAQAIADVDVRVVEDILVLKSNNFDEKSITKSYKALASRMIQSHVIDEYTGEDRKELDGYIFDALKLTQGERDAVYEAVINLVQARLNKAKSV